MTDSVLVFEHATAGWSVLLALGLVAAWLLAWRGLRSGQSRARRRLLLGLRTAALAAVGLVLLEPALQRRRLHPLPGRVVVLVDTSQSMRLKSGSTTRAEQVADFLHEQASALDGLASRFQLEVVGFDQRLRPLDRSSPIPTDGPGTDLLTALGQAAGTPAGESLSGLILISDGADTEELSSLAPGDELPAAIRERVAGLGVVLHSLAVGAEGGLADLAIEDLAVDEFAFIRNAVEVDVTLRAVGLGERSVPLVLEEGGRILASRDVVLQAGRPQVATLKFVPDRVGEYVYRVEVPLQPGEALADNNSRTFVTRVIRDKIRVLHLVGRPSWDERFLREFLKRNPNVDLVSFFILRSVSDVPGVSQDELSLIPFPVAELFGTELPTFDVVLFQNFNHGPYQVGYFLPQLRDYVLGGGALWMIGGDLSFGSGGYTGSPLEDVLPVRLRAGGDWRSEQFRPLPAPGAAAHPVLELGEEREPWSQLPPLMGFNHAAEVVPGSEVLLVHPFERSGGEPAPVLALREVGRGRSAALLSDGTWRWGFAASLAGLSPRIYSRLCSNLLRWLIRDPALEGMVLRPERSRFQPNEPVRLSVHIPAAPAGERTQLELWRADGEERLLRRAVDLDESGRANLALDNPGPGAFRLRLERPGGGRAEVAFVVEADSAELRRSAPRPDLLAALSLAAGGRSAPLNSVALGDLPLTDRERFRVESVSSRPLLQSGWMLALLVGLLAADWWLRRRWGFA